MIERGIMPPKTLIDVVARLSEFPVELFRRKSEVCSPREHWIMRYKNRPLPRLNPVTSTTKLKGDT